MNVLVVCHGNVNRSAAAAAILARDTRLNVLSSGHMKGGRRAAAKMRRAMAAQGYDLEAHRSVETTQALFDWADVVLAMDSRNLKELSVFSEPSSKVKLLGDFLSPPAKIPDPCWIKETDPKFSQILNTIIAACMAFTQQVR